MKQRTDSTKIQRTRRCKINSIEHKRWASYATTALASGFTLCLAESAEAEIHYSGPINQEVPTGGWCKYSYHYHTYVSCQGSYPLILPLGHNGVIRLSNYVTGSVYGTYWSPNGGSAYLAIFAPGAAVRGVGGSISRLLPGDLISAGPFGNGGGYLASRYGGGQFQAPGWGFVGFKFNTGAGEQYGWVRVRMDGVYYNTFGVADYAVGDPGEVVKAGQRRSHTPTPTPTPTSTPRHSPADLESLGGLALGAAGLLAWRRRRRANQRAAA